MIGSSAKRWTLVGGVGPLWAPADRGQGKAADLADTGAGAADVLATLEGENHARNLDLKVPTFPGPIAEAYYWSNADIVGIVGPVGSGKTTTKMKRKLRRAMEMPRSVIDGVRRYKCVFIRETYRQLWSTTIPSYLETFPKHMGTWSGGRGDPVTHVIPFQDEHGDIEFTAEFMAFGDTPLESMRGIQTTDIDLNEADTMVVEVLTAGIGRIDRWPGRVHFDGYASDLRSYGSIDCDFNAPDEDNWVYKLFYDEAEQKKVLASLNAALDDDARRIEIGFFNQPGYGEPGTENVHNLSAGYYPRQIAAMKMAGRGDMIERLVYNRPTYLRIGDPVFRREFRRRIHLSEP